jgi:hypothetical protein
LVEKVNAMSPVIRISEHLYSRLEQHAKGFDTPANVIETLLNHFEGVDQKASNTTPAKDVTRKRDTTKYSFKNHLYGKGKLVLAVVKDYVASNPKTTYDNLVKIFPKHLQGSIGVFNKLKDIQSKYKNKSHKRHFVQDPISLKDCDIVVSTEWGAGNINDFIEQAISIGYSITPTNG